MEFSNFIAEDQLIDIIPKFNYNKKLNLLSGEFGPFIPAMKVKVPIWLALNLRQQKKCEIVLPDWINELSKKLEREEQRSKESNPADEDYGQVDETFEPINENWLEILKMFESDYRYNFKPLIERRESILKNWIHKLLNQVYTENEISIQSIDLHNLTRAELCLVKKIIQESLDVFQRLRFLVMLED